MLKNKDYLFNNIKDILKSRLLITDKKKKLNNLFIKQGLSRTQAINNINKILWLARHKATF